MREVRVSLVRSDDLSYSVLIGRGVLGGSPGKMKSGDYPPSPRLRRASEHE